MEIIARKTKKKLFVTLELVSGIVIMAAVFIWLPIALFSIDKSLLTNIYVWGFCILAMLFFGSVGYFCFLRPYVLFRKLPDVQAETDGTYLYIHGPKEAKIPLAKIKAENLDSSIPYIMSSEFIVHLLSEQYGTVYIKVPRYGKFKLRFVSRAQEVHLRLVDLIEGMR